MCVVTCWRLMAGRKMYMSEDFDLEDYNDAKDRITMLQAYIKGHLTRKLIKEARCEFEAIFKETEKHSRYNIEWISTNVCLPKVRKRQTRKFEQDEKFDKSDPSSKFSDVAVNGNRKFNLSDQTDACGNQPAVETVADSYTCTCSSVCVCGREIQSDVQDELHVESLGNKTSMTIASGQDNAIGKSTPGPAVKCTCTHGQFLKENTNNNRISGTGICKLPCSSVTFVDDCVTVAGNNLHTATQEARILSSTVPDNLSASFGIDSNVPCKAIAESTCTDVSDTVATMTSQTVQRNNRGVLPSTADDNIPHVSPVGTPGKLTGVLTPEDSGSYWGDCTSFWEADETACVDMEKKSEVQQGSVQRTGKPDYAELRGKRHHIAMELLWVQQAIHSRKNYLRLKQSMKE